MLINPRFCNTNTEGWGCKYAAPRPAIFVTKRVPLFAVEICTGRAARGPARRPDRAEHGTGRAIFNFLCDPHMPLANACIIRRRNRHQVISCLSRRDAPVPGVAGCGRGRGIVFQALDQSQSNLLGYTMTAPVLAFGDDLGERDSIP